MSLPSEEEQLIIRRAVDAGRTGSATITLLAQAHDIASRHNMLATVEELRRHIYALLPHPGPSPLSRKAIFYTIILGLISGIATAFVFSKTRIKHRLGIEEE